MSPRGAHHGRATAALLALAAAFALGTPNAAPAAVAGLPAPAAAGAPFLATFDGSPAAPLPYAPQGWDVQTHSRNTDTWYALEPMDAQHGPDCAPPPATHPLAGAYQDAVFQCHDHLMTALNASGYGVLYLTPPVVADFSPAAGGEAIIRWDMSTLRTSARDWVDVWVTPYADNLALPLDAWLPDLNGPPRRAVHLRMDTSSGGTIFRAETVTDFAAAEVPSCWWCPYEAVLTPDAVRRDTFELHVSRTHLRFGLPAYGLWWVDADIADLGWDTGVVQLGHHSYTPGKDCPVGASCTPNTWHWDTVSIAPAQPFTILRADRRYVDAATAAQPVTFGGGVPAPGGAMLRFAATGNAVAASFDDGATWLPAPVQPGSVQPPDTAHAVSYWVPVPAGTVGVLLRAEGGWWGSQWIVQDMALWVPPGVVAAVPTETPTATATATAVPPTATATATATATPPPTKGPPPRNTPRARAARTPARARARA